MCRVTKVLVSFAIFFAVFGLARAATPVRQCANKKPLPLMVQLNKCAELPCDLYKGIDSHMAIQFVATKNSMSQLRADVRITTLGAEIPLGLTEERSNVCENLMYGAYCPLDAGEDVTYHLIMSVSEQQPEVRVRLEVSLVDRSDNSVVACFVTDGRFKKSPPRKN